MLRAVLRSALDDCPAPALLDVSDSRTLRTLLDRGGLGAGTTAVEISVDQLLDRQRFVPSANAGLCALRKLLASAAAIGVLPP